MAISKVVYGNETLIDISEDTITADDLAQGKTAHGSDGGPISGTHIDEIDIMKYGKLIWGATEADHSYASGMSMAKDVVIVLDNEYGYHWFAIVYYGKSGELSYKNVKIVYVDNDTNRIGFEYRNHSGTISNYIRYLTSFEGSNWDEKYINNLYGLIDSLKFPEGYDEVTLPSGESPNRLGLLYMEYDHSGSSNTRYTLQELCDSYGIPDVVYLRLARGDSYDTGAGKYYRPKTVIANNANYKKYTSPCFFNAQQGGHSFPMDVFEDPNGSERSVDTEWSDSKTYYAYDRSSYTYTEIDTGHLLDFVLSHADSESLLSQNLNLTLIDYDRLDRGYDSIYDLDSTLAEYDSSKDYYVCTHLKYLYTIRPLTTVAYKVNVEANSKTWCIPVAIYGLRGIPWAELS